MTLKTDKSDDERTLEFCLGQLRHAYMHLTSGNTPWPFNKRQEFARGLIGPVIERLETLTKLASRGSTEPPP